MRCKQVTVANVPQANMWAGSPCKILIKRGDDQFDEVAARIVGKLDPMPTISSPQKKLYNYTWEQVEEVMLGAGIFS